MKSVHRRVPNEYNIKTVTQLNFLVKYKYPNKNITNLNELHCYYIHNFFFLCPTCLQYILQMRILIKHSLS